MDCYLPADFFLVDDLRRRDDIDPTLGADAHVHFESPAFVTGLRDWHQPRHSRGSGNPATSTSTSRKPTSLGPRGDEDAEWRPL